MRVNICIRSEVKPYRYHMTKDKIFVMDSDGVLIKKIALPVPVNYTVKQRIQGFKDMYYDGKHMWVILGMNDYYDVKMFLNETTLELGKMTPYK